MARIDEIKVLKGLANRKRLRILRVLRNRPMTFSELMREVGMGSSGELGFHLNKLAGLVVKKGNKYYVSEAGLKILEALETITREPTVVGIDRVPIPKMARCLIILIIALVTVMWISTLYFGFMVLPEEFPTSFLASGEPAEMMNRFELLYFNVIMTVVTLLSIIIYIFRFDAIERIPFMVSLPAFVILLHKSKLTPRERGEYINKIYMVGLFVSLIVVIVFMLIEVVLILIGLRVIKPLEYEIGSFMALAILGIVTISMIGVCRYNAKVYNSLRERIG